MAKSTTIKAAPPAPKAKIAPKAKPTKPQQKPAKPDAPSTAITDKVKAIIAQAETPKAEAVRQVADEVKPADPTLWTELDFGEGDLFRMESRAGDLIGVLKATFDKKGKPNGWRELHVGVPFLGDALRVIADDLDGITNAP